MVENMAYQTTVTMVAGTWVQLTNADITALRFQNLGPYHILVKGTADATAPTDTDGAIRYNPGQGEPANADRWSEMFPGITFARVYAYCEDGGQVSVSHA